LEGSSLGLTGFTLQYKIAPEPTWSGFTAPSPNDETGGEVTGIPLTTNIWAFPNALSYGGHYYWTVKTVGTTPSYSAVSGEFTVVGGASTNSIQLSFPSDASTISTTSTALMWYVVGSSLGIHHYKIIYSSSDEFAGDPPITISTTSTTASKIIEDLTQGATYYWKIRAYYNADESSPASSWSEVYQFTVMPGSLNVVVQPIVGGPNNLKVSTNSPTLSWYTPVAAAANKSYEVQIAENSNFSDAKKISTNTQSVQTSGLKSGKDYYWRVRAKDNSNNYSYYSCIGKFGVSSSVTAVEEETIPTEFALEQNYPNPFNPTTRITYSLPKSSFITLKIYDMLGREVRTLVNQNMSAGYQTVEWNGEDNFGSKVASGAFIYRITAGGFVSTKKMLLIK
jgi:hypothetical protein